jgi:CheY-like chemotaxis protein
MTMCDLLVLDDDPLVRMVLVDALRDEGMDVIAAAAESEALAVLRQPHPPRVFVTDLDLGTRRNGFVVAAIARMLFPEVPIVYITGRSDAVRGRMLGEHETLMHKPFLPSELVATVHRLMTLSPVH